MKKHLYLFIFLFLALCITSLAIDVNSPNYGEAHKNVFNNPDNCIFCHLYDEDVYRQVEGKSSTEATPLSIGQMARGDTVSVDDEYDDEEESDGGSGWFFGKGSRKTADSEKVSSYLFASFTMSGFVNKEYVIPHEFNRSITSQCVNSQCHTERELGNSHAVDVPPFETYPNMKVPAEYPLNWDTNKYEEVLSCGTCHNPHVDWLYREKFYEVQKPFKRIKGSNYFKTYFLRVRDAERGYVTLCKGCHGEGY